MKIRFLLLAIFAPSISFASDVGGKTDIRELSTQNSNINWKVLGQPENEPKSPIKPLINRERSGNLPYFLVRKERVSSGAESKPIKFPELAAINRSGMDIGDEFDCVISQDIVGYVGAVSPVKANVLSGPFKGSTFIGNATLDPNTKNVLVEFSALRLSDSRQVHNLKATVHSVTGELGLAGTHHSNYWKYFFATVVGRTAEGYANTLVERQRNIFGTYQEVPSTENAGKTAVAEAASSTADLLTAKMRDLPEYTVVKGPIRTKIFILETPTLAK